MLLALSRSAANPHSYSIYRLTQSSMLAGSNVMDHAVPLAGTLRNIAHISLQGCEASHAWAGFDGWE